MKIEDSYIVRAHMDGNTNTKYPMRWVAIWAGAEYAQYTFKYEYFGLYCCNSLPSRRYDNIMFLNI